MSLNLFQKIAFAVMFMALQVTQVSSSSNFLDNSIIGDFSTIGEMNPEVVISFLGSCAGKSIDISSCPVSTFINNVFGNDKWGSQCVPILSGTFDMVVPEFTSLVNDAFSTCGDDDVNARNDLIAVLTDSTCFSKACQDDAHLDIESAWMRSCANIHLPYSKPRADGMFTVTPDDEDIVLSCMLHEAMSSPASDFGLSDPSDTPIEKCYPPGYPMAVSDCHSTLAPVLFARCSAAGYDDTSEVYMSMYTGFQGNEADISNDFCTRMDAIAAPNNLACLTPLCDYTAPTPTPSVIPSMAPSNAPTTTKSPSAAPSSAPTESSSPSMAPSISPSTTPSKFPSASPTGNPTTSPSSIPTVTPGHPSAAPTTATPSSAPSGTPTGSPSTVPSDAPSDTPSDTPSNIPSMTPSIAPSKTPSTDPSVSPSIAPSNTPSVSPSSAPSWAPSTSSNAPSQATNAASSSSPTASAQPTHAEAQATVETEVYSEFTLLGINSQDVASTADLGSFFDVLSNAVISVVDDAIDGDISVEIVVLGGIETRRLRQLQNGDGLDVEFKATIVSECFRSTCGDGLLSSSVAEKFESALINSIHGGASPSLAATINAEAQSNAKDVAILQAVTVEDKPLAYFTYTSKVVRADISAARAISGTTMMVSLPAFTASLLVLLNLAI